MMSKVILLVIFVGLCVAEPPVNTYLPAVRESSLSSKYGAPSSRFDTPSHQYGAPSGINYDLSYNQYNYPHLQENDFTYKADDTRDTEANYFEDNHLSRASIPAEQYGKAASQYSTPSSTYGTPSSDYSSHSARFGTTSSLHSTPHSAVSSPATKYGAALHYTGDDESSGYNYEAPATKFRLQPSGQYGVPEDQYASSRSTNRYSVSSAHSPLSSQYGAPSAFRSSQHSTSPSFRTASSVYGTPSAVSSSQHGNLPSQYNSPTSIPSSHYGVPSAQVSSLSSHGETPTYRSEPSSQYGNPSAFRSTPSTHYGASSAFRSSPSSQYGSSSAFRSSPSSQYGTPSAFRSTPSSQYGAPSEFSATPSSQYSSPSSFRSAPSAQYGASLTSNSIPSSEYGTPFTGHSLPSSRYGIPSNNYGRTSSGYSGSNRYSGVNGYSGSNGYQRSNGYSGTNGYSRHGTEESYNEHTSGRTNSDILGQSYSAVEQGHQYARGFSQDGSSGISEPAKYEFNYDVKEKGLGVEFGQEESRDGEDTNGSYHVLLPDGRRQRVQYTAGQSGYKPTISYEDTDSLVSARAGGQFSNGFSAEYESGDVTGDQYSRTAGPNSYQGDASHSADHAYQTGSRFGSQSGPY